MPLRRNWHFQGEGKVGQTLAITTMLSVFCFLLLVSMLMNVLSN